VQAVPMVCLVPNPGPRPGLAQPGLAQPGLAQAGPWHRPTAVSAM